jgi:hypothetical protein
MGTGPAGGWSPLSSGQGCVQVCFEQAPGRGDAPAAKVKMAMLGTKVQTKRATQGLHRHQIDQCNPWSMRVYMSECKQKVYSVAWDRYVWPGGSWSCPQIFIVIEMGNCARGCHDLIFIV